MNSEDKADHSGLRNMTTRSDEVAKYYDDWAEEYDRTLAQWQYEAPQQVASRLRAELSTDADILDAGCGTGLSGEALAEAGFQTIDGMDVSQRSLDVAAERGVYRSLRRVDMQKLPLPHDDDSYDGLACVGVLTYIPDSKAILKEFCRIVKPGGVLLVTQRSDLLAERNFPATLADLQTQGLLTDHDISEPMPYLPENEEFHDEVKVHYITCRVS